METTATKRVLISEEGVKDNAGHWAPYSQSIVEGLEEIGASAVVAGHADATVEVRSAMPFEPVFRFSRWDGHYEHRPWLERKALVALHNRRLYRDMAAFLERSEPFDVIFCGNILVYHSFAWRMLVRRFLGKKFHHLVLMMVQPAGSLDRERGRYVFPLRSKALAWSLADSVAAGKGRVSLAVETPAAQAEFSQLTGKTVHLLHHPVEAPDLGPPSRPERERLRLVCPGFARFEKGSDVLLEAIRKLSSGGQGAGMQFTLQWKKGATFAGIDSMTVGVDEELQAKGVAKFEEVELVGDDYWRFLAEADLIVLPYRGDPYTTRLSRVTIEAMIVGKPVIYPKGSWLEFAVEESGAGVGFEDGSADSLAEAVLEARSRFATLAESARDRAAAAAEHYSARSFAGNLMSLTAKV